MIVIKSLVMEKTFETWYFDSYALQHRCNNKKLFKNLWAMYIDFVIAAD